MLIRFEVENHRSINEPVELSMVAVDQDRAEARAVPELGESLVTVAGIYGPNASGKSNIISAMTWLMDGVRDSRRFRDNGIPLEPFAFAGAPERVSVFTIESLISGVRFEYTLKIDRESIHYEALFHYPEAKRCRVFEREGDLVMTRRGISGVCGLLAPRTLVLSSARRLNDPLISTFSRNLLAGQTQGLPHRRFSSIRVASRYSTLHWLDGEKRVLDAEQRRSARAQALALLRMADQSIEDVVFDDQEVPVPGVGATTQRFRRHRLVHRTRRERVPVDFDSESEGIRTWFQLIGPILGALRSGSVLLVDQLDSGLHPMLSARLIQLFHAPTTNPLGAQLIFTSHDTSLLNHLNRDEVWLTEKTGQGATQLSAVADFAGERVRRSKNLESGYLHGRFGALPDLDNTELLRALNLIN